MLPPFRRPLFPGLLLPIPRVPLSWSARTWPPCQRQRRPSLPRRQAQKKCVVPTRWKPNWSQPRRTSWLLLLSWPVNWEL
uniref:Uncharacterized protein n=1 Tax=Ixodes ricinus TaxID=34613 RepID=A0A6B0TXY8_IXORI